MYLKTAKFVRKGLRWESKKREHDEIERVNDEHRDDGEKRDDDEKEGVNDEKGDERIGERDTGVEPASQAWEARALPMC